MSLNHCIAKFLKLYLARNEAYLEWLKRHETAGCFIYFLIIVVWVRTLYHNDCNTFLFASKNYLNLAMHYFMEVI